MTQQARGAVRTRDQCTAGKEQRRRGAVAGASGDCKVDRLVGGIVVSYHEVEIRVRRCVESRRGRHEELCPELNPRPVDQRRRAIRLRHQKRTRPCPKDLGVTATRPANLGRLRSPWAEVRRADPKGATSYDLVGRVEASRVFRDGVAHSMRARGDSAVRNHRLQETYGAEALARYLEHVQCTLECVRKLYRRMGMPSMA